MRKYFKLMKLPFVVIVLLSKTVKIKHLDWVDKSNLFLTMILLWVKSGISTNKEKVIEQKVLKYRISAYGYHTLFYLLEEIFFQEVYYFRSDTPKPAIIDCGANIGISALYFKYLYPDCKIHCYEPNPTVFKLLERNIERNNLTDIHLYNIALSDKDGILDFYIGEEKGSFVSSVNDYRGGAVTSVSSKQLSALFPGEQFDLIKIDVEGAEWQIMADLEKSNRLEMANQYVIEYHHNMIADKFYFGQFLQFFEKKDIEYSLKADYDKIGGFQCIMMYVKIM